MGVFRVANCVMLMILMISTSTAQADYPLTDLQPITPNTATDLTELARIDGALQGQLAWSSDLLAVGTTAGVQLFDLANPQAAPMNIAGNTDVAFNETGDILTSGGQQWDVQTGTSLGVVVPATDDVTFSPSGNIAVTTTIENDYVIVQVENIASQEIFTLDTLMQGGYRSIVFSPDERFAALLFEPTSLDYGVSVQLWDIAEGEFIANLPQQLEIFDEVVFHADGQLLVVATKTNAVYGSIFEDVQIYDAHTGEHLGPDYLGYLPVTYSFDHRLMAFPTVGGIELWSDHKIDTLDCANLLSEFGGFPLFSPTNYDLAAYSWGGVVLWHLDSEGASTKTSCQILETNDGVTSLAYSSDGALLAGETEGRMIYLWDVETGDEQFLLDVGGDYGFTMQFHPTENKLLVQQFGGGYQVWDAITGEELLTAPRGAVLNAEWTRAAYWDGGTVHVIDSASADETTFTIIPDYLGRTAALSPTRQWIAFIDTGMSIYDLQTGDQVFSQSTDHRFSQILFSDDGSRMAIRIDPFVYSSNERRIIQIWDTTNLDEPLSEFEADYNDYILSPNGQYLALNIEAYGERPSGSETLTDTETGVELTAWDNETYGNNTHAFSPDSTLIANRTGGYNTMTLWDIAATLEQPPLYENFTKVEGVGAVAFHFEGFYEITRFVFSPDGQWLAAAITKYVSPAEPDIETSSVYIWSVTEALAQSGVIENGYVEFPNATSPLFSPSGDFLMTEDYEGDTLRLWDVATGSELHAFPESMMLAFTPDESIVVTYGANTLTLWDTSTLNDDVVATPIVTIPDVPEDVQEIAFNDAGTLLFVRYASGINVYGIAP